MAIRAPDGANKTRKKHQVVENNTVADTKQRKKGYLGPKKYANRSSYQINSAHDHQPDKTMSIKKDLIVFILLPEDWISPKFSESPTRTHSTRRIL